MNKEDIDAKSLYSSSKHLKYFGLLGMLVLLSGSVYFFWTDTPALGYTFGVCSLMFLGLAAAGNTTMRAVQRHLDKQ